MERKEQLEMEIKQYQQQLVQAQQAVQQLPIMIAFRQGALEELDNKAPKKEKDKKK
jgi:hypothetical protein